MDLIYLVKKELFRRKYSNRTIKTYCECIKGFLNYCSKEPRRFTKKDVKDYLYLLTEKNKSGSTINVNLQALKFALKEVLNKDFFINIKFSKTPKSLPVFLTKSEILRLFDSIENYKHKLMIKLLYSSGMRVSELLNVRVKDFDFENNYGWVRRGKGNKDRMFIIAQTIKKELIYYIEKENIGFDCFLFQSYNGRMSSRTVQEILKKARKKAKIMKNVHPHTLRHSYATHLIENGYDINSVQTLLGHNSPETTRVYLHTSKIRAINVRSPLDDLQSQPESQNRKQDYENK